MTEQEAIRLLRTEIPGDSEAMELAKHMGADAIERRKLRFVTPVCEECGSYIPGVAIRYVPEISDPWRLIISTIDPALCPKCLTTFVSIEIDTKEETCILRGPKKAKKEEVKP